MKDIWFLWDPIEREFLTFATVKEQQEEAKAIIQVCMDNQEWADEVHEVVTGVITSRSTQYNRIDRPENLPLDKDGFDVDGELWAKGEEYICDYKMQPICSKDDLKKKCLIHF